MKSEISRDTGKQSGNAAVFLSQKKDKVISAFATVVHDDTFNWRLRMLPRRTRKLNSFGNRRLRTNAVTRFYLPRSERYRYLSGHVTIRRHRVAHKSCDVRDDANYAAFNAEINC